MWRARRIYLSAMVLLACSGPAASEVGNSVAPRADEEVEEATAFSDDKSAFNIARSLCIESARRRFGISPDDVTGSSFGGGGDDAQSIEGQATLDLFGPPARSFRCEIKGSAVASIAEMDENGDPVAARK